MGGGGGGLGWVEIGIRDYEPDAAFGEDKCSGRIENHTGGRMRSLVLPD